MEGGGEVVRILYKHEGNRISVYGIVQFYV